MEHYYIIQTKNVNNEIGFISVDELSGRYIATTPICAELFNTIDKAKECIQKCVECSYIKNILSYSILKQEFIVVETVNTKTYNTLWDLLDDLESRDDYAWNYAMGVAHNFYKAGKDPQTHANEIAEIVFKKFNK